MRPTYIHIYNATVKAIQNYYTYDWTTCMYIIMYSANIRW